ncbi:antirepressor regulating drug resistance protein [Bernardetia litoralis DSM 6794]|uniref:Antirepressor regulating drug resistance protein n=1 Tax=Bernardetia litoralis (strain ATCC 23117 / DSM 6794 / NBRC 15988 / NCIMB 1366 / Fx l1 / Sio-4) TaxID=880071 RepID=I4AF07_BERLS|nr:M56 family metallopeptidase [Bernardetia litoralis]AFM02542.1 antirepressor regulating drug resistance protein [Bernardetia litoralis DSM 6794]
MKLLFFDYLLQCSLFLTLLYIPYFLFLKKETFFSLNRKYLIFALSLTLVLPFFPLNISNFLGLFFQNSAAVTVPDIDVFLAYGDVINSASTETTTSIFSEPSTWIFLIYVLGIAIIFVRIILGLSMILKLYFKGQKKQKEYFTLIETNSETEPFSFFNWVFISKKNHFTESQQNEIIAHEKAHVRQKHAFDLLLIEFLGLLLWFNPLIYFYKKALRDTHEYLADAETITHFSDKKQYLNLLINQHFVGKNLPFVTKFHNYSLLKKRVIMITKSPSRQIAKLKIMLAVPALFLCLFMTSCLKEYVEISERSEVSSNDFAAAFPKDYEVGKSYKIRSTTTMELDLEKDNDYMIRLFPAEDFEGVEIKMFDEKGELLVRNYIEKIDKYYRGFTFRNTKTAKYRLEITVPNGKKNVSLAMASRKFEAKDNIQPKKDKDGFTKVKTYDLKENKEEYTVVFSEGTEYKISLEEEEMSFQLISEDREKVLVNFTSTSSQKNKTFTISETAIYYLKIEKEGIETKNAELAFKREAKEEEAKKDNK